jgi:spore coat polysaccharide biosynthesis predicted glycosyltransferase SpsG
MVFVRVSRHVQGYLIAVLQVMTIWQNYITELCDRANRPEYLEIESEEKVDIVEKDSYILHSEVEKAVKGMRDKKAVGDDDVPRNVLKLGRRLFPNKETTD